MKICDDGEKAVGKEIRMVSHLIRRNLENRPTTKKLRNMSGTNAWLIVYINRRTDSGEDVFQKDIERDFGVTRSSVSRVIKLMEDKGLIARESVEGDARLKKIVLTEESRAIGEKLKTDANDMEKMLTKGFSESELEFLFSCFDRMMNNLTAEAEAGKDII